MGARQAENIVKAVSFAVISYFAVATMGAFAKFLPAHLNLGIVLFSQYIFGFIIFLLIAIRTPSHFITKKPHLHIIRIVAGILSFGLFIFSLKNISLVNSIVLRSTTPFFIPLILLCWKRQKIDLFIWSAIILGFIGILLIIKPSFHYFNMGMLYALLSGFFMAIAALGIRRLSRTETSVRVLLYYFGAATIIFLPFFVYHISEINSLKIVLILFAISVCMFVLQYGLMLAFSYHKTSTLAPLAYTAIAFSGLYDWFIWHQIPDVAGFGGIVLVIIAAVLILWQQRKKEKLHEKSIDHY